MSGGEEFSTTGVAHFRHHPARSTLCRVSDRRDATKWDAEPAVVGHRSLVHCKANGERIPVPICATPAIIGRAGIILASYDGVVRFLDPSLTKEYWNTRLQAGVYAPLVVDSKGPAVFVACIDGTIARLGLKGTLEWSVSFGEYPIYATPLVLSVPRLLVVATYHGRCFGVDMDDGSLRFNLDLPRPWHAAHRGLAAWRDPYASPAAVHDDTFVLCCAEKAVLFDKQGVVRWEHAVGTSVRASPAFIARTKEVLVVAANGECLFVSGESGRSRKGPAFGARVVSSPAVSGCVAAIGTVAGDLFGVDVENGEIAWRKPAFAPRDHSSVSLLPSGDFIVVTERGNAAALGASDGLFLWESDQRLGLGEQDPRMDLTPLAAPDGHLYGASYSGSVYSFLFPQQESSLA